MNAISLFSGMGGDSYAIEKCGLKLVAYSEKEEKFRQVHELNFDNCTLLGSPDGNIIKTTKEEILNYKDQNIDLVFAGFPCQGFSNAGKKLPDDPRNTLFREFLRVTRLLKPKYIIGENVKGLLSRKTASGELYIDIIEQEFEKLDYIINYEVMKAHEYGVPQKRERLIIVGVLDGPKFEFPEKSDTICSLETPKKIVNFDMTGAIKINEDNPNYHVLKNIPQECILTDMKNEEDTNNPHPNLKLLATDVDYTYTIKKKKKVDGQIITVDDPKTYKNRLSFGKRASSIHGEIIDIRNPCKTIICTYARQPRLFVPLKNKNGFYLRCLLPNELKQIQGFPPDYNLGEDTALPIKTSDQIVMIGNAVPPPLIEIVINKLVNNVA
uniref:Cytosine-specific methyltransferase n=1 Tax=Megaviridae environmental sample TaxID=1737588 RepID=A0A5J6VLT7_9VIRU|nr:MAG: C-5 cytosine-specific DNA methylase [Megaviridae environmental sample]